MALAFRADYEGALTCVRVCAAIGDARKINVACGRNLSYFLERLTEKMGAVVGRGWMGGGSAGAAGWQRELEGDEEMLALLTGDMQGDGEECAWVWAGSERRGSGSGAAAVAGEGSSALEETSASNLLANGMGSGSPERADVPYSALLTEKEINDWGGFERCERLIEGLREEQRRWEGNAYYRRSSQNEAKRLHLAPPEGPTTTMQTRTQKQPSPAATTATASGGSTPVGASRISIANII